MMTCIRRTQDATAVPSSPSFVTNVQYPAEPAGKRLGRERYGSAGTCHPAFAASQGTVQEKRSSISSNR